MLQQHMRLKHRPTDPVDNDRLSVSLPFPKHVAEFLQRASNELRLLPQVRRQEPIRVAHGHEGGFQCVLECLCGAGGGCVDVLDAGELEETLDSRGSHESGTTGGRDELVIKKCQKPASSWGI